MITYQEALNIIKTHVRTFGNERISLELADGRIIAEDICADRNYPPFNRAAMDGYAIMLSDWQQGIGKYKIEEVIYAGQASTKTLRSGSCYKIMTGAATPPPANAIVRREDAEEENGWVKLSGGEIKAFHHMAREGEDAQKGDVLLKAPARCTPQVISLLAAVGQTNVSVKNLPTVAVITTGDEVVAPDQKVSPFEIRNSNSFLLKSLLKKWNISPNFIDHIEDNKEKIKITLEKAIKSDITIVNGGVSAGDADFVPHTLKELGVKELFHKLSIKPGKPLWTGVTDHGGIVFALPGNPLSCLTTFTVFIESYLYKCFGFDGRPVYRLPFMGKRQKNNRLAEFFPVKLDRKNGGIHMLPYNGSGDITAGLFAQGLAVHPLNVIDLNPGELIDFYPFHNPL